MTEVHYVHAGSAVPPPPPPPPGAESLHEIGPRWAHRLFGVSVTVGARDLMRSVTWAALVVVVVGTVFALLDRGPIRIPVPTHILGPVCPACGLTRGTIATLRGDVWLALQYNPFSPLVPLTAVVFLVRTAVGLRWDRWVNVRYRPTRLAWVLGAATLAVLWAYQWSRADFLVHSTLV